MTLPATLPPINGGAATGGQADSGGTFGSPTFNFNSSKPNWLLLGGLAVVGYIVWKRYK